MRKVFGLMCVVMNLTACHQSSNPLASHSNADVAKMLLSASRAAEDHLGIKQAAGGYAYSDCMQAQNQTDQCQRLYVSMLDYFQRTYGYASLTISQISSRQQYRRIRSLYSEMCYAGIA